MPLSPDNCDENISPTEFELFVKELLEGILFFLPVPG
jgi:hypothetical protein